MTALSIPCNGLTTESMRHSSAHLVTQTNNVYMPNVVTRALYIMLCAECYFGLSQASSETNI